MIEIYKNEGAKMLFKKVSILTGFFLYAFIFCVYGQDELISSPLEQKEVTATVDTTAEINAALATEYESVDVSADIVEKELAEYHYTLKELIEHAKKNIEKVEKEMELQKKEQENRERELKARQSFEEGNALYDAGQHKEAVSAWQKALEITHDPKMKKYVNQERQRKERYFREEKRKSNEEKQKKLSQARTLYLEAIYFYKKGKYTFSQAKFEKLEELIPNYGQTKLYLQAIPEQQTKQQQSIQQRENKKKVESLYREGVTFYNQGKITEAEDTFNELLSLDVEHNRAQRYVKIYIPKIKEKEQRKHEAEEKKRLEKLEKQQREKEKIEQEKVDKQAENLYKQAISFYQKGDYEQAAQIFTRVENISSGYRDANLYLEERIPNKEKQITAEKARIREEELKRQQDIKEREQRKQGIAEKERLAKLEKERARTEKRKVRDLSTQAVKLYNQNDLDEAEQVFKNILAIDKDHGFAKNYLRIKIPEMHKKKQAAERQRAQEKKRQLQREKKTEIENSYNQGVSLYHSEKLEEAKVKFQEVLDNDLEHRGAKHYLSVKIPNKEKQAIAKQARIRQQELAQQQREHGKKERQEREQLQRKADKLYGQARSLYGQRKYGQAYEQFKSVCDLIPNYRNAQDYLKKIPELLEKERKQQEQKSAK